MSKFYSKKINQLKLCFALILIGIVTLSSCGKNDDDIAVYSALSVINASPTVSTYDVYLGDSKFNTVALPYGGGTIYTQKQAAAYSIKFTTAGRGESLYTATVDLNSAGFYTYFLLNRPNSFDGLLVKDDLSGVSTDKAIVRFFNLSPDAPALDLFLTGGTTAIVANKTYKAVSGYTLVTPGSSLSFDIKDGSGTVRATVPNVSLAAGFHYTIIAGGYLTPQNANERSLNIQVVKQQ